MEKKENKTMKKVLTISALALILGLVGYTGGSTFAKYISTMEKESDTATVAQWGYTLSADASNLFGNTYLNNDVNKLAQVKEVQGAAGGVVVEGVSGDRVAPGTTGSATFSVQGQAEVLSKLTVVSTVSDVSLSDGTNFYRPVKWTVSGTAKIGADDKYAAAGSLSNVDAAKVDSFLDSLTTKNIAPKTVIDINLTITWVWAFEGVASTDLANLFTSDADDKLTGNQADTVLANGGKHYNGNGTEELSGEYTLVTSTSFSLDATVEQLATAE